MTKEEKQYKKMTEGSTSKLVFTLGLPAMISMLVTAIYNIADTLFVSKIDADGLASAAVTIVFPLMAIIQAIGFTFGMGSGSLISSKLGERKEEDAQRRDFTINAIYLDTTNNMIVDPYDGFKDLFSEITEHAEFYFEAFPSHPLRAVYGEDPELPSGGKLLYHRQRAQSYCGGSEHPPR